MRPAVFFDPAVLCTAEGRALRDDLARPRPPLDDPRGVVELLSRPHVDRLTRLCAETGADAVVVWTWSRWFPFATIVRAFELLGCGALQGLAHVSGTPRGAVRTWLHLHPAPAWVILHPSREGWADDAAMLARLVSPADGLTDDDTRRAAAILHPTLEPV